MFHLGQEVLRRILAGEGATRETEKAVEHIVSCDRCRAVAGSLLEELRVENPGLRGEGPLQLVFDLADRERQWGVDSLAAMAEWADLRHMPSRRSQRDRVRMSKACHTIAFFNLVLSEHQALANAARHVKEGTGDPRLEAGLLSITASALGEEGYVPQALDALQRCWAIYEGLSEWSLLARTLVKVANLLVEDDPANGLAALDRAVPLIPAEDCHLTILAELLRVRCLIELQKPVEALQVYRRCSRLFIANPRVRLRLRSKFTGAQLLDALGFKQ